jgi:hypothetical protein
MAGYFSKMRKKPKHVRDNIAFSMAGGITFVLALTWFLVGFESPVSNSETITTSEEQPAAFSTLLNQIQEQAASVRESVSPVEEIATSSIPVGDGAWGIAAQYTNSSTSKPLPREANIMIISASSSPEASSTAPTSDVLY